MALCFDVEINGERSIVAGRAALDVLTTIVTYVRARNELELRAGALQGHPDGSSVTVSEPREMTSSVARSSQARVDSVRTECVLWPTVLHCDGIWR